MEELDDYERRFRRAGLPLLIEGWSAREDALPRAFPLLAVVFVGELLGAPSCSSSPRRCGRRSPGSTTAR